MNWRQSRREDVARGAMILLISLGVAALIVGARLGSQRLTRSAVNRNSCPHDDTASRADRNSYTGGADADASPAATDSNACYQWPWLASTSCTRRTAGTSCVSTPVTAARTSGMCASKMDESPCKKRTSFSNTRCCSRTRLREQGVRGGADAGNRY